MAGDERLGDKLLAVHRALDAGAIRHAFGGAIALAYAVPNARATVDLDLNIAVPIDRAQTVLDALPPAVQAPAEAAGIIGREGQIRLRWGPNPIDLFFPQHTFHAVVDARAVPVGFRGDTIRVITATDLTVFKALFDRPKDWVDITEMLRAGAVDREEALRWVAEIVGADADVYLRLQSMINDTDETDPDDGMVDLKSVWSARS
jgi:hypothetical protein